MTAGTVFLLGFAGFAALLVWLGVKSSKASKARRATNEKVLKERGWSLIPTAPDLIDEGNAHPFRQGRERNATNAIRSGHRKFPFVSFEYAYVAESKDDDGKVHRSHGKYNVTSIELKGAIDQIKFMPEGMWDGKWDLDMESDDFNKKWKVLAKEKRLAHAILAPTVIALMVDPKTPKMPIIFEPGRLWTYRSGSHDLGKLDRALETLVGIAEHIPAFVYKEARKGSKLAKYVEPAALVDDPQAVVPPVAPVRKPGRGVGGTNRRSGGASTAAGKSSRSVGGTNRSLSNKKSSAKPKAASKAKPSGRARGGSGRPVAPKSAARRSRGGAAPPKK